jgi:homoserine kinase
VHAFASGQGALLTRALDDGFAEPRRAQLIPHFHEVKAAALQSGALGCSISGAGPTLFAICHDQTSANACLAAMQKAFRDLASTGHVGRISKKGARAV